MHRTHDLLPPHCWWQTFECSQVPGWSQLQLKVLNVRLSQPHAPSGCSTSCFCTPSRPLHLQGDHYSIGYFVWPRDQDTLQGPKKRYPQQTMAEFMKIKGGLYGAAFSADPTTWAAQQHMAFGPPVRELPAEVTVQG